VTPSLDAKTSTLISIKQRIRGLIDIALSALEGIIPRDQEEVDIHLERARQRQHGDFACNVALVYAKAVGMKPRDLASQIVRHLPASDVVDRVEIAGPGFINFHLAKAALYGVIAQVHAAGEVYGHCDIGERRRILVEFVSSNPTGPLHVGHGRGAAYGDALVRVLRAAGFAADSEYYVNDAGRQMDILTLSVWLRYLQLRGHEVEVPDNAYQGDYLRAIANEWRRGNYGDPCPPAHDLFDGLGDAPEERLDTLIERCQQTLGEDTYQQLFTFTRDALVEDIQHDLQDFGVRYDNWFFESQLVDSAAVTRAFDVLKKNGYLYLADGAWWFRSTKFGDEKDRVVKRANGNFTYFASDIAYHLDKAERGYQTLINIWGADHHGYLARVKGAFGALGCRPEDLVVLFVQFAVLYRSGEKVSMSTRGGEFVSLRHLRQEVGNDAARFFYTLRKPEQHMDFDLDLAKSQSSDNPVYYVQYAHARVCSVFRQLVERGLADEWQQSADYALLTEDHEMDLLASLTRFPDVVEAAALAYEPHQVAYYLRELANDFHTYYNAHPFLASEPDLRDARLGLIDATRQVIANGLCLLGVSAPESM